MPRLHVCAFALRRDKTLVHKSPTPAIRSEISQRREFYMGSSADNKTCAICLGSMESGQGQAIFTAECAHSFHFSCIGNSVTYGNYLCPVCRAKWNDLPFTVPNYNTNVDNSFGPSSVDRVRGPQVPVRSRVIYEPEPILFSDDEPLPLFTADPVPSAPPAHLQNVSIKAIPERTAVASSESVSEFAVLVGIRAPSLSEDTRQLHRAPIDLVTVLDVSGSMHGSKLALLKSAVVFVIDNLGPSDRLSIVSFSTRARRILPLRRMTEQGRESATRCVNSLLASGSTNIVEALKKGVQVLEERRHQNTVSSIIFLSDGRDTCYRGTHVMSPRQPPQYLHLLPASICPENRGTEDHGQQQTFPIHAFGFGTDHDPLTMHAISDASGGTFSFIESYEMVQDAFASCIGGLLSVVIQELRLMVRSASHGVQIRSISSGRYASEISNEGSQGLINVGDLYADEEKEFLANLSVPVFQSMEDNENDSNTTSLLDITCSYTAVVSNRMVLIDGDLVNIRRPKSPSPLEITVSLEVDRQRNRLAAAQGITEAQQMAETGNLGGARALLSSRRSTILTSASGQIGDGLCMWLETEMKETEERMGSKQLYERAGRAYALSNMSSHSYQRATTRGRSVPGAGVSGSFSFEPGCAASRSSFNAYATPNMANMVNKSHELNAGDSTPSKE